MARVIFNAMTYFQYDTDKDTVAACLGIIERAAARVERGKSAFLGAAHSVGKARVRTRRARLFKAPRRSTPIPPVERDRIVELLRAGRSVASVAGQMGCPAWRVYYLRDHEGLNSKLGRSA